MKPVKKIYLAGSYTRREELSAYRHQLGALGFIVTSRWLDGTHEIAADGLTNDEGTEDDRCRFATEDIADLQKADIVISFTEPANSPASRGGRHVEFGMAIALGKACFTVGPQENVFHCLRYVPAFRNWEILLRWLAATYMN